MLRHGKVVVRACDPKPRKWCGARCNGSPPTICVTSSAVLLKSACEPPARRWRRRRRRAGARRRSAERAPRGAPGGGWPGASPGARGPELTRASAPWEWDPLPIPSDPAANGLPRAPGGKNAPGPARGDDAAGGVATPPNR